MNVRRYVRTWRGSKSEHASDIRTDGGELLELLVVELLELLELLVVELLEVELLVVVRNANVRPRFGRTVASSSRSRGLPRFIDAYVRT